MEQSLLRKLFSRIGVYSNPSNQYINFIHRHQIHIKNVDNNLRYETYRIPISFGHLVFPMLVPLFFGIRSMLVLYYHHQFFNTELCTVQFFTGILPEKIRYHIETCLSIMSVYLVVHLTYTHRLSIVKYKLFAALICDFDNQTSCKDLGLT